jgi:nucleoside-diphosphate-sugar epimerase
MNRGRACVTGAAGFLASHVIAELLRRGYEVVGTVRDPGDAARTQHLRRLPGHDRLELRPADLLRPGSFDTLVADCAHVLHTASPVILSARDPARTIVAPAVDGTRNVFGAIARANATSRRIERVVLTSSIAAVRDDTRPADHVLTEADWNDSSTLRDDPYPRAKALAERAAWATHADLPTERRPALVVVNPTVVFGPVLAPAHGHGSARVVLELLRGRPWLCPRLHLPLVDVRDVALAHVEALERPQAEGRHILFAEGRWLGEIARTLREAHPGRPIPRRAAPDWLVRLAAPFVPGLSTAFLRRHLGVARRISADKARRELGIDFRSVDDTIRDTATSLIDLGLS